MSIYEKETWNLFFMEVHTVPVVCQGGHLAFPELQERDSPEGHEDTEEHCAWMVKQVAQLQ